MLPVARAAKLIPQDLGPHGSGLECVANTVRHLDKSGIHDDFLPRVLAVARAKAVGRNVPHAHLE
jgi:cation transport regulator ChaC